MLANGYLIYRQNQWMRNYGGHDNASKREYDLVLFDPKNLEFLIIECKAHFDQSRLVDSRQVYEFVRKLEHYNGQYARRLMITDTDYTLGAIRLALQQGIEPLDGQALRRLEQFGSARCELGGLLVRYAAARILDHLV